MEMATFILAVLAGVFGAGMFIGYKYRDLVGKEVTKFASELRSEAAKARAEEAVAVAKYEDIKKAL